MGYLLHEKFLTSVMQDADISYTPASKLSNENNEAQEICLSLGIDDDIKKEDVIQYLVESGKIQEDQILKIRVIKRRTFIEVSTELTSTLLNNLKGALLGGRMPRINLVNSEDQLERSPNRFERSDRPSFRGRSSDNRSFRNNNYRSRNAGNNEDKDYKNRSFRTPA